MEKIIKIKADQIEIKGKLNQTQTAQKIWDSLPIESKGSFWGDEIYFDIPVKMGEEDPREVVEKGDMAYWPSGSAFCIFFGPTPASQGDEIRPASGVNVIGKILENPEQLKKYNSGNQIRIEKS